MSDATIWSPAYATSIKNLAILFPLTGYVIMFVTYQFIYNLDSKKLAEIEKALGRNGKEG